MSSVSSFDMSNFMNKYQIGQYIIYSPYIKPFLTSFNTLINNSQTINMTQRYMYRPDYVSYDYYGTTDLWYLIMRVNNVYSIIKFNMNTIIVPNYDIVTSILAKSKASGTINNIVSNGG